MQVRIVKLIVWAIFSVVILPIGYTMDLDRHFITKFPSLESNLYNKALKKSIIDGFSVKPFAVKINGQEYYCLSRFPTLDEVKKSFKNGAFDPVINELDFNIYPRIIKEIAELEMKDEEFKLRIDPPSYCHMRKIGDIHYQMFSLEALFEIQFSDGSRENVPVKISTQIDHPGVGYLPPNFIFAIAKSVDNPSQFIICWNFNPKVLTDELSAVTQKIFPQTKSSVSTTSVSNYRNFDITKLSNYRSSMEQVDYDFVREPLCAYRIRPSRKVGEYTLDLKGSVETYSHRLSAEQVSSAMALQALLDYAYRRCLLSEEEKVSQQFSGLSIRPVTQ